MDKEDVCVCVCFPMGYHLATRKKETLPFLTTWMDLEDVMLRKTGKTKRKTV